MSGTRKSADRWSTDCARNAAKDSPTEVRDACAYKIGADNRLLVEWADRSTVARPIERATFCAVGGTGKLCGIREDVSPLCQERTATG
jgi:hypothetical protein